MIGESERPCCLLVHAAHGAVILLDITVEGSFVPAVP
jgi:hypothetical protein